jgi:hypothetical protein
MLRYGASGQVSASSLSDEEFHAGAIRVTAERLWDGGMIVGWTSARDWLGVFRQGDVCFVQAMHDGVLADPVDVERIPITDRTTLLVAEIGNTLWAFVDGRVLGPLPGPIEGHVGIFHRSHGTTPQSFGPIEIADAAASLVPLSML